LAEASTSIPRGETAIALPARRESAVVRRDKLIFLLPAVIAILCLSIFPMIFSIMMVFSKLDLHSYTIEFYGLNNIARLVQDEKLLQSLLITARFVVTALPVEYVLGFGLALLLNQEGIRFRKFWRVFFLLPMMLSPVAISYDIGQMLFHATRGPINQFLRLLGLPPVPWLSDPGIALYPLIIIDIWQWTPFIMILMLAGLQSISTEIYDAARIDGAGFWQTFRYITWPLLLPITVTVTLIRALEMFKVVETIFVVTGGGPGRATESITLYAYQIGFKNLDLGYAATIAQVLLILMIVFTGVYLAFWRNRLPETTT